LETVAPASVSRCSCADLSSNHCRQRALVHLAVAISLAVDTANRADHEARDREGPLGYGGTGAEDARPANVTRTKQMKQNQVVPLPCQQELWQPIFSGLSALSGSIVLSGTIVRLEISFSLLVSRRATIEKSSSQNSFSSNSEEAFMSRSGCAINSRVEMASV
jgi:hypothetical protein